MKLFIRAVGNISPQRTFGNAPFLTDPVEYSGNRLTCVEPDYKNLIDPKLIRRMSRIIQMGVAAAGSCLQEAGIAVPDAIVTGTAYGCLQDTGAFLSKMVEYNEELLTPTSFIQSTHNTIGAQIALMLKCNQYNNAFVHRGFSFESALLDGRMLLMERPHTNALIGAVDEITQYSHTLLTRLGLYKQKSLSNLDLFQTASKGTLGGEGACFFLLTDQPSGKNYASIDALDTFYKPESIAETENHIQTFLKDHSTSLEDIDLVIAGKNGDPKNDETYEQLQQSLFNRLPVIPYKHLCGEYPTSTAFAVWAAANMLKEGIIPAVLQQQPLPQKPKTILIYNNYQRIHHSLLLISAC